MQQESRGGRRSKKRLLCFKEDAAIVAQTTHLSGEPVRSVQKPYVMHVESGLSPVDYVRNTDRRLVRLSRMRSTQIFIGRLWS